jgi:hypothetical protein
MHRHMLNRTQPCGGQTVVRKPPLANQDPSVAENLEQEAARHDSEAGQTHGFGVGVEINVG